MSITFLSSNDFKLQMDNGKQLLVNNMNGLSLVLFYSTKCQHCQKLLPIIKEIPKRYNGCQIGIINVGKQENKSLITQSSMTNTPIKYVPYIILYVNHRPIMRYDDDHNLDSILKFITDIANNIKQKQIFAQQNAEPNQPTGPVPLCGEFGCSYCKIEDIK